MSKKKFLLFTLLLLSAGIVFRLTIDSLSAPRTSDRVPFTITQAHITYSPSGNWPALRREIVLAVRGNGSFSQRTKNLSPAGTARSDRREVYNVAAGTITAVDPLTQSKTTAFLPESSKDSLATPIDTTCGDRLRSGSTIERNGGILLGYKVVRTTENSHLPDGGTATTVALRAPELNCFPLREEVTFVAPDGTITVNLREVQSVVTGEPDPELFDVPASYTERSPSDVVSETARLKGVPCSDCGRDFLIRADQKYQQNRPAE